MSGEINISELMSGVTKGIFSLDMDHKTKTQILVDIILEYQYRNNVLSINNSKNLKEIDFNTLLKELNTIN